MMTNKLNYTKERTRWIVSDELGNKASGVTREQARQQYELLYEINKPQCGIDMRDYIGNNLPKFN